MAESVDIAIVGAGQAGLSLSHQLSSAGIEHLILERARIAESWRNRWDSFCLVIPNWTIKLPGGEYQGDDPDGFLSREEIADYLVSYARSFDAPVREGAVVRSVEGDEEGGFLLDTSSGLVRARRVVVASGGFQKPYRPPGASELPGSLQVLDADDYSNPGALADGRVLIVGSGQTGCQLAEELFEAGRDVFVACGRAPWVPRRLEGRDIIAWIAETPFMEEGMEALPHPGARFGANPQITGHEGGHDMHYRTLQAMGVNLLGRFIGADDGAARFAPDLAESVAFGDFLYGKFGEAIVQSCARRGVKAPEIPQPPPFHANPPERVPLEGFGAVIFTAGYRPVYSSWIRFPDAFDPMGFPIQQHGSSTVVPGLHFMGVHFQRKRKSSTLYGVGEDARVLAERLVAES